MKKIVFASALTLTLTLAGAVLTTDVLLMTDWWQHNLLMVEMKMF